MLRIFLAMCLSCSTLLLAADPVDWSRFSAVAATGGATVEELTTNITAGFASEKDKAAAIFYWITHNVAYDTKMMERMLKSGMAKESHTLDKIAELKEEQVQEAFVKRKGVCQNYARLYLRMCEAAGLEGVFITGHARSNAMQPGSLGVGHAWNGVKIDDKWHLVDATWAAGGVNAKGKFEFTFKPGYFMPEAESFSYSHLPDDPQWQLLETAVTEEDFLAQPAIGSGFLQYGFSNLNHLTYRLDLRRGNPLEVVFTTTQPPGEIICANMTVGAQIPCTVTAEGDNYRVSLPAKEVRNMVLNLRNRDNEIFVSYRLSVR